MASCSQLSPTAAGWILGKAPDLHQPLPATRSATVAQGLHPQQNTKKERTGVKGEARVCHVRGEFPGRILLPESDPNPGARLDSREPAGKAETVSHVGQGNPSVLQCMAGSLLSALL